MPTGRPAPKQHHTCHGLQGNLLDQSADYNLVEATGHEDTCNPARQASGRRWQPSRPRPAQRWGTRFNTTCCPCRSSTASTPCPSCAASSAATCCSTPPAEEAVTPPNLRQATGGQGVEQAAMPACLSSLLVLGEAGRRLGTTPQGRVCIPHCLPNCGDCGEPHACSMRSGMRIARCARVLPAAIGAQGTCPVAQQPLHIQTVHRCRPGVHPDGSAV